MMAVCIFQWLSIAYVDVVEIPVGATHVKVAERNPSRNYLALRSVNSADQYYINGAWTIDWPKQLHIAGTQFTYQRLSEGRETLFAPGPTAETLIVMLLVQEQNAIVEYEYSVLNHNDVSISGPRRHVTDSESHAREPASDVIDDVPENIADDVVSDGDQAYAVLNNSVTRLSTFSDRFSWRARSWTPCSVSCARGVEHTFAVCVDKTNDNIVASSYCTHLKYHRETRPCYGKPCPAQWHVGPWSECVTSCDSNSYTCRTRTVACVKQLGNDNDFETAADDECNKTPKPDVKSICTAEEMFTAKWISGEWTECWPPCGRNASRSRMVRCVSADGNLVNDDDCSLMDRPASTEHCSSLPACPPSVWITGPWSQCSASCGRGEQMRSVGCRTSYGDRSSTCDLATMPRTVQPCDVSCTGASLSLHTSHGCRDTEEALYCPLVLKFHFCNRPYFQRTCCHTCARRPMSSSQQPGVTNNEFLQHN